MSQDPDCPAVQFTVMVVEYDGFGSIWLLNAMEGPAGVGLACRLTCPWKLFRGIIVTTDVAKKPLCTCGKPTVISKSGKGTMKLAPAVVAVAAVVTVTLTAPGAIPDGTAVEMLVWLQLLTEAW